MLRRRRPAPTQRSAVEAEDEWEVTDDIVDDVLATLELIHSRSAKGFREWKLPPLVLWHQLYAVLPNRTRVDQSVHEHQLNKTLISFPIPTGKEDYVLVQFATYEACIDSSMEKITSRPSCDSKSSQLAALKQLRNILQDVCMESSITIAYLHGAMNAKRTISSEISVESARQYAIWLQRIGFLRSTTSLHHESFTLSLPGIGKLVTALSKTRSTLLSTLKRTKYKEVAETQLKKRKLRHSTLPLDYHLSDMEGRGLVRRTKVTSGTLVAVVEN